MYNLTKQYTSHQRVHQTFIYDCQNQFFYETSKQL